MIMAGFGAASADGFHSMTFTTAKSCQLYEHQFQQNPSLRATAAENKKMRCVSRQIYSKARTLKGVRAVLQNPAASATGQAAKEATRATKSDLR